MARENRDVMARGRRAEAELTETEEAFKAVEAALLKALIETGVGNDPKILKLHAALQNLGAVRAAILQTIREGKDAASYERAAEDAIAMADLTRP